MEQLTATRPNKGGAGIVPGEQLNADDYQRLRAQLEVLFISGDINVAWTELAAAVNGADDGETTLPPVVGGVQAFDLVMQFRDYFPSNYGTNAPTTDATYFNDQRCDYFRRTLASLRSDVDVAFWSTQVEYGRLQAPPTIVVTPEKPVQYGLRLVDTSGVERTLTVLPGSVEIVGDAVQ